MKFTVAFYSLSGNTLKVAEAIGDGVATTSAAVRASATA
jgi:flavodoxin